MKHFKTLFISGILMLFLVVNLSAQDPDTLWTKIYGGVDTDRAYSVQQTSDGGYIIAGETWSYGAGENDVWLLKTDEFGDTLWTRTYGGGSRDYGTSVEQITDGGYIIAGYRGPTMGYDFYLIRTDSQGDTLWTKTYGGGQNDKCFSVQQTTDGGYILTGYTESYGAGAHDVWIIKTDSLGNTVWTKVYGGTSSDVARSIRQTSDGGYIIAAYTESYGAGGQDVWLLKTDEFGDTLWTKTYGGANSDRGVSVLQTADGGYIIGAGTESYGAGSRDFFLIKTYANGNVNWMKTYGGTNLEDCLELQQTTDSGYIMVGYTESYGAGARDVYIIRTDANGDTLWTGVYGGTGDDLGRSVQQTSDGGYIIAAYTESYGAGGQDVWLLKIVENTPPLIDSTTVWADTSYCGPFPVYTKVTDNIGVDTVLLYFKRMEDPVFFSIEMLEGANNWYYEAIPEAFLPDDTVKYYIYARDILQYESTDPPGAPGNYYWFIANFTGIEELRTTPEYFSFGLKSSPVRENVVFNLIIPEAAEITLKIYDVSGRLIYTPMKGRKSAGVYEISWTSGGSAGVYFYCLESSWGKKIGKFILIR